MIGFRISASAMFVMILIPAAAAENTMSDTFRQHHRWTQKLERSSDPSVSGSMKRSSHPVIHLEPRDCLPMDLRFSHAPFAEWRIGSCS
jgi:hypothetical protein